MMRAVPRAASTGSVVENPADGLAGDVDRFAWGDGGPDHVDCCAVAVDGGSVSGLRCGRWFGEGEYAVTESVKGSNHKPERKATPYLSLVATDVQSEFIEKSRVALHFFGLVRKKTVKLRS